MCIRDRHLELQYAKRWRQRILARLTPYDAYFPSFVVAAMGAKNVYRAYHDLFGTSRYNSLAGHGRRLDKILHLCPTILPFTTGKILRLFDIMRDKHESDELHLKANTPMTYWRTIYYVAALAGLKDTLDIPLLERKRDAVRATLVVSVNREDKRATPPTTKVIIALERVAINGSTWFKRYMASVSRHGIGATGRFNDYQHTSPDTHKDEPKTSELAAWQTKVSDPVTNYRPMPLIAPKISFSGHKWWETLSDGIATLNKLLGPRDYMIPTPTIDRTRIEDKPLGSTAALKLYREILIEGGFSEEEAREQTLSGWRVYMPEQAYQANISKERRQYLGRWAGENMADTYTRQHREVVIGIWAEVLGLKNTGALQHTSTQKVPVDIQHPYYFEDHPDKSTQDRAQWGALPSPPPGGTSTPPAAKKNDASTLLPHRPGTAPASTDMVDTMTLLVKDIKDNWIHTDTSVDGSEDTKSVPQTAPSQSVASDHENPRDLCASQDREDEDIFPDEEQSERPSMWAAPPPSSDGFDYQSPVLPIPVPPSELFHVEREDAAVPDQHTSRMPVGDRIPFDEVPPDKGGPLTLIGNNFKTKNLQGQMVRKAHLARADRRCICGYPHNPERVTTFTNPMDWENEYYKYHPCTWCWRLYTVPQEWLHTPGAEETLPDDEISGAEAPEPPDEPAGSGVALAPTAHRVPPKQLMQWRDLTRPTKVKKACKHMPAQTQRNLELQYAKRWRQRILSRLTPYEQYFPSFVVLSLIHISEPTRPY